MFNTFFLIVGSNIVDKIPLGSTKFESYLPNMTALSDKHLTEKEFQNAIFTLKPNKSPGYNYLYVSIIRSIYHDFTILLMNIFCQLLSTGTFPSKMKIVSFSYI